VKPRFEVSENTIKIELPVFEDISDLTDDEHLVLKALSKTVLKSISEIVPSTPFGKSKVSSLLKILEKKGVVLIQGKGRSTKYIIK
jgi:ATP-dependent DNA helicase RecG